ncbi:HlyD family type I secretion periplasmic adaptor subunit [Candidatus Venteria ishoeyi]|uniref:HlyD family type I secretion periplasmic adaptor subunit n=2 Tax=Candidatus Venteria ishoeyi TaxID=1899563 RepID=UPI0025A5E50E|nr:HlyD family type I secretion periplasmic adaptor subunit [Candidatus Venteria ishoeyi]MDM8546021.1 HlyD family type I secretion periplasmic adaptor subunit [Candidatus Venteria ishoeyi]
MQKPDFLLNTRTHFASHLLLWLVFGFMLIATVWAYFAEIDEVTRGQGRVIPSRQVQQVQNLEGGIVVELKVSEGDIVEQDQILLRIDDTRFASSYQDNNLQRQVLQAKIKRLEAETRQQPLKMPETLPAGENFWGNEQALYFSRQQELKTAISVFKRQLEQKQQALKELQAKQGQLQRSYQLANKELKITQPLVKQGIMSEVELLRLKRQVNDLRGDMNSNQLTIPRAKAAINEAKGKIAAHQATFLSSAFNELNETQAQLSRLQASKETLTDQVTRTAVRSPVRGTIKTLHVNTIGGVVQPGMTLAEIVPLEDNLLIEAEIRPADIAFLHPGQKAMVKFTAYDFAIFGGLPARLEYIGADTIHNDKQEAVFLIRVRTEHHYLGSKENSLPIIPGMTTSVDILTGRKTVLDYLLKPFNRMQERALRER